MMTTPTTARPHSRDVAGRHRPCIMLTAPAEATKRCLDRAGLTYSAAHDSELNKAFVRDFEASTGGKQRVNFAAVAAYGTMAAIYKLSEAQGGRLDAEKTAELVKGFKLDSPRGSIEIDGSRDIVQTIYIRRVERRNGRLENIEFSSIPNVPATEAR